MKKIFTASVLMAVAFFASAFTAPKPAVKVEMTPERAAMVQARCADVAAELNFKGTVEGATVTDLGTRSGGWNVQMVNMGQDFWTMFFEEGSDGYNYYYENWTATILAIRSTTSDDYQYYLICWPTNAMVRSSSGFPEPAADAKDGDPYSIDNMIATGLAYQVLEPGYLGFCSPEGSNQITAFGIWFTGTPMTTSANQTEPKPFYEYVGYESYMNNRVCAPEPGSTVEIRGYDKATSYVDLGFDSYLVDANNQRVGSFLLNYDGDAYVDGFEPITKTFTITECHLVDTGVLDADTMEANFGFYCYTDDWGPVHRYYLMMCGAGLTWPLDSFRAASYPSFGNPEGEGNGPWLENTGEYADYNYFRGALYAASDCENYGGVYRLYRPDVVTYLGEGLATQGPSAYTALVSDYNPALVPYVDVDGVRMAYYGYYAYLMAGSTIQTLTKEGILINGYDQYNNTISLQYKGNLYYHNNPDDFTEYIEVSAIGTNSGVNTIVADSDSVEYFDLNGRRVSGELVKGIYIKREGMKASKVLVK